MGQIGQQRFTQGRRQTDLDLQSLLAQLPAAAYTCDPAGLITYFNERAAQTWGRRPLVDDPQDRY